MLYKIFNIHTNKIFFTSHKNDFRAHFHSLNSFLIDFMRLCHILLIPHIN